MQKHYLIIDGNSIGHMAQALKPLTVGTMQVQAIYGFLRIIRTYISKYSFAAPIVLWDGLSWRYMVYPQYKEDRKKEETKHDVERKEQRQHYQRQRPHIEKMLSFLGVAQVRADNMEADDLAAMLSNIYTSQGARVTLLSEDKDWLQLVRPGVVVERPRLKDGAAQVRVTHENFKEITGCETAAQFVEMKALMGDKGDGIDGLGGIGDKRALDFLAEYGSFNDFLNRVSIEKSIDIAKLPKWQRDLVTDESKAIAFDFNLRLVDLNTKLRPAPVNMIVNRGEPNLENFRRMCELLLFKSITDNLGVWVDAFPVSKVAAHPVAA